MSEVKYLVKVDAVANNNKFYRMIPMGNNFRVEYGRLGNSSYRTQTYPMSQWYSKFNEKLGKGYVDQSHLVFEEVVKIPGSEKQYKEIEDKAVAEIINRLQVMARQVIAKNYRVTTNNVTSMMIQEAQRMINRLTYTTDLYSFNSILEAIFAVIPRRMNKVSNYLADSTSQFGKIISREQSLLDAMAGQVNQIIVQPQKSEAETTDKTILESLGITMRPVTAKEEASIKKMLGMCAPGYVNAWRVENLKTRERYRRFKKENNIKNTMILFHGSRNENWFNIIQSGLLLRPSNVVITGKMFGCGIYFAKKAIKSKGYTSLYGSRWANGNSNLGFLALYEVAIGTPFDVYGYNNNYNTLDKKKLQSISPGAHCLYAHKGQILKEDEVVIYDEAQATIKFLLELKN